MSTNNVSTLTPSMLLRQIAGAEIGTPRKINYTGVGGAMHIKTILHNPIYVFLIVMGLAIAIWAVKDGQSMDNIISCVLCILCASIPIVAANCHSRMLAIGLALIIGLCCCWSMFAGGDDAKSFVEDRLKDISSKMKSSEEESS